MQIILGEVQRGVGRGRVLGYPTINLPFKDPAVSGVYSALVYLEGELSQPAVVFVDTTREIIEAHILDFDEDLYGRSVKIELHNKIRDAKQFSNDDELKVAIDQDILKVRKHLLN